MALSANDGGFRSRKFVGYAISSALCLLAGHTVSADKLGEVVMGLVAIYGAYSGTNVLRDWTAMKSGFSPAPPAPAQKAVDKAKPAPKAEAKDEEVD